jgi:hypothetical protein
MKTKYYVRMKQTDQAKFEAYAEERGLSVEHLSNDFGPGAGTSMYAASMDEEEALALSLTFPLIGCLNFHKTMKKPCASNTDALES